MSLLELKGVNQRFGGLHALKDLTFKVEEGEVVGIIGPNGAGKSTMFNTIVGVTPATSGTVLFDGVDVTKKQTHDIVGTGLVKTSQTVQIFSDLTVLDNVVVGTILHIPKLREAREFAFEQLEFLGLEQYANLKASQLTLAYRARLELARALSLKPRLLMVDELMAGMTESEVSAMLELLLRMNSGRNVTLIIIEHNMRAIMHLSHRIIALIEGALAADGEPEAVSTDKVVVEAYLGVV